MSRERICLPANLESRISNLELFIIFPEPVFDEVFEFDALLRHETLRWGSGLQDQVRDGAQAGSCRYLDSGP